MSDRVHEIQQALQIIKNKRRKENDSKSHS